MCNNISIETKKTKNKKNTHKKKKNKKRYLIQTTVNKVDKIAKKRIQQLISQGEKEVERVA